MLGAALVGCGGGSGNAPTGTTPVAGRSVSGQALAPSNLVGRAVADAPLPGAAATLTDATAGLPGTVVATTTTDSHGNYHFSNLVSDHIYIITVTKQVTDDQGHTFTLSMGTVAPPADSTGAATGNVTPSSTVALGYVLSQFDALRSGSLTPAQALQNIASAAHDVTVSTQAARDAGTAPPIDLSKPAADPASHQDDAQLIVSQASRTGAFLSTNGNSTGNSVNMLFDKDKGQVIVSVIIRDSAGDIFDTDAFVGTPDAQGNFSGDTLDGGYTIKGTMVSDTAQGTWMTKDGASKGYWQAGRATHPDAHRGTGYKGVFTGPKGDEKGMWLMFVDNNGTALIYGRSDKADHIHLKTTVVLSAQVTASGSLTGKLVFPIEGSAITGSDPTQGSATVTGGGTSGGFYGDTQGSITGTLSGDAVSGTWAFKGKDQQNSFDESGTWSGVRF